ncbi:MAG TPA: YdiU family protein, partial [Chitinophagaceae bacterium]|nr:YdiU family protein [Chitinophagaceae bacterium]
MQGLSEKVFKKEFISTFNGDKTGNLRPRQTPGVLYSKAVPTPVSKPGLLAWSEELAKDLGIGEPREKDVAILGGNLVTPSMFPYAACYAGHQFGNWAGQLGDGRAITLGEWPVDNERTWELQLKGAGPTAYSRRADGRAVLRSSVREYLMSEAMFHLGVPTTRALSLVATGDKVLRDMFYNGNAQYEPGAIVMRAAPTLLRFGNFEMLASRNEVNDLRKLTDWTIQRYYPHITGEDKIVRWFGEVVERTAKLMVEWMRVGFVHGVMNTDNMSILGLTIDYGPYSFVDDYDLNFTPNTTDLPGRRYAFGRQPAVGKWNLGCLGGALSPLLPDAEGLIAALDQYDKIYWKEYYNMMWGKLGLSPVGATDVALITELEKVLSLLKPDMTIFFQLMISLPDELEDKPALIAHFNESFYEQPGEEGAEALFTFFKNYEER